ncbi:hypothetical protein BOTNAR_0102g00220 [Botryotinia narcissicola]|uniref:NmrA-like domain-containing protein n=1 Tax=Botryotinia narcissicola TaxID=278944 RepID=A0A4Z1IVD0_9HELO|nr:hypothetical protein BOTNAR_0102g00220 [Botryotinia narcissicola]
MAPAGLETCNNASHRVVLGTIWNFLEEQTDSQILLIRKVPFAARTRGPIDWTTIQVRPDIQVTTDTATTMGTDESQIYSEIYLEVYFDHFHHRWPIVHCPSHEEEANENESCELSMRMIGTWLLGTGRAVQFAIDTREIGFFRPETAWPDERKGYFASMRYAKLGQRQRLAYCMFKLGAYISVLRNKPMTIFPEELHFPLPCTLSLWNAKELQTWEERQNDEPTYRNLKSMLSLIADSSLNADSTQEQPMLIEDIHLCLDQRSSTVEEFSEAHRLAREQRRTSMNGWASTTAVRFALCQSVDVLVAQRNLGNGSGTSANIQASDPIRYAALCVSALIVWTFCKFCDRGCKICVPGANPVADLTTWSMPGFKTLIAQQVVAKSYDDDFSALRNSISRIAIVKGQQTTLAFLSHSSLPAEPATLRLKDQKSSDSFSTITSTKKLIVIFSLQCDQMTAQGVARYVGNLDLDVELHFIAAEEDTGHIVEALVEESTGENVIDYRGWSNFPEIIEAFTQATAKKVDYVLLPKSQLRIPVPPELGIEMEDIWAYYNEIENEGRHDPTIIHPKDLNSPPQLKNVVDHFKKQDWSQVPSV